MAQETENKPDFDQLFEELRKSNRQVLHYTRSRMLGTWLAVALLALFTGIALSLALRAADTNLQQTDDIARVANTTADAAAKQSQDTIDYLKGDQGIPGVPGADGQDGTPGQPSSQPGPRGPMGQAGDQGQPGSTGANGPAGPQGLAGTAGPLGPAGENGLMGADGSQGPKGDKGDEGARGAEGPTGPAGPQGPPGSAASVNTAVAFAASPNDTAAHKQITVTCANGRASGGGFATVPSDPGIDVSASSPVGNTGWSATADVLSLPAGTNWQLLAFAICVT